MWMELHLLDFQAANSSKLYTDHLYILLASASDLPFICDKLHLH